MGRPKPEPCLFIIFGALGDLSQRKLLPALSRLAVDGQLGPKCHVLGVSRETNYDDAKFADFTHQALKRFGLDRAHVDALVNEQLHYQTIGDNASSDYDQLAARIEALETKYDLPGNRAIYLALPPPVFPSVIAGLGGAGLNDSKGWTRLVVEKPFGKNLETALTLNQQTHHHFNESQIYRIDHYLGKETVQNLLVFRLANNMIESVWNRDRVEAVQITVAESLGVGTRAGYYDTSGALRDMVQNHLTQVLTLVAMEPPVRFDADAIRHEKIKVLRSIAPLKQENVVLGQYTKGQVDGEAVPGYLEADGVAEGSKTPTFVALNLQVNSWRWQGVPFYLRTGKRLPRRMSQIALRFRETPINLFESMGAGEQSLETADVLVITLQPDEGFSLHFDVKTPGAPFNTQRIPLSFRYKDAFEEMPEAYQTLLLDVLSGDQTLFVHSEEVEESWRLYTPLLEQDMPVYGYPAGTWGPPEADDFAIPERDLWHGEAGA